MRCPGIEPEASEWKSEMLPLHQQRFLFFVFFFGD